MFNKSLFKKYSEMKQKDVIRLPDDFLAHERKMPYLTIGIKSNRKSAHILNIECQIDTGCGFLLSLPLAMSKKLKGFERQNQSDGVAIAVTGEEINQLAVRATVLIAGLEFDCICHFSEGIDKPILGMPLFLRYLDLNISNGQVKLSPTDNTLNSKKGARRPLRKLV